MEAKRESAAPAADAAGPAAYHDNSRCVVGRKAAELGINLIGAALTAAEMPSGCRGKEIGSMFQMRIRTRAKSALCGGQRRPPRRGSRSRGEVRPKPPRSKRRLRRPNERR